MANIPPPSAQEIKSLAAKITSAAEHYAINEGNEASEAALATMQNLARDLDAKVQNPGQQIWFLAYQMGQTAALRTAIEMNLFSHFPESGSVSLKDLSAKTGSDPALLVRLLRVLCAIYVFTETNVNEYAAGPMGKLLADPRFQDLVIVVVDDFVPIWHKLPSILQASQFQNPSDPLNSPFNTTFQTSDPYFAWLGKNNPRMVGRFMNYLSTFKDIGWLKGVDDYPFSEILAGSSDIAMVDVGGAIGDVSKLLVKRFPDVKGKFIVQDLPHTIEHAPKDVDSRIEFMGHDFFTEQPIRGARAYYLRNILHDWPDVPACAILRNLRPAFVGGHSKLLLGESVVPPKGAKLMQTMIDMTMMTMAAKERTEEEYRALLESEGFELRKIWQPSGGFECLLEGGLKGE